MHKFRRTFQTIDVCPKKCMFPKKSYLFSFEKYENSREKLVPPPLVGRTCQGLQSLGIIFFFSSNKGWGESWVNHHTSELVEPRDLQCLGRNIVHNSKRIDFFLLAMQS